MKYNRKHSLDCKSYELKHWPFLFEVEYQEIGVQQRQVFVYCDNFFCLDPIYLTYKTDEFWGYETKEKAKNSVEEYIEKFLNNNQN